MKTLDEISESIKGEMAITVLNNAILWINRYSGRSIHRKSNAIAGLGICVKLLNDESLNDLTFEQIQFKNRKVYDTIITTIYAAEEEGFYSF